MANRNEIAKLLDVTERRVNQLVRDEGMPRIREGEYDRAQVLIWYSRFLLRSLERAGDPSDLQGLRELRTQKHRLLRAQGDAAELALMQERTAVVPVQLYREVFALKIAGYRAAILGLLSVAQSEEERSRWERALLGVIAGLEHGVDFGPGAVSAAKSVKGSTKSKKEQVKK